MKTIILGIISILICIQVYAYEIERISFPFWMGSIHTNATEVTENHHPSGFCLGHFCHMEFTNSFGRHGSMDYIDARVADEWYLTGWKKFGINGGFLFASIWGYDIEPMPVLLPYFGLCYKGKLPVAMCAENSFIPAPDGSGEFLTATVLRIYVFNKEF